MLNITYRQRKKNVYIHEEMISRIGTYERVLQKVKRRKISWFGHESRMTHCQILVFKFVLKVQGKVFLKGIGLTMSMSGPVCLFDSYLM